MKKEIIRVFQIPKRFCLKALFEARSLCFRYHCLVSLPPADLLLLSGVPFSCKRLEHDSGYGQARRKWGSLVIN